MTGSIEAIGCGAGGFCVMTPLRPHLGQSGSYLSFSKPAVRRLPVSATRDKKAALACIKNAMKRHGQVETVTTDSLHSYGAAMDELGHRAKQESGCLQTS
jgi:hypothetical protein